MHSITYIFLIAIWPHLAYFKNIYNDDLNLSKRIALHNELTRAYKNAICCKNNLKCCVHVPDLAKVGIRAVLINCPTPKKCELAQLIGRKDHFCHNKDGSLRPLHDVDEQESLSNYTIRCRKKMMISIKISKNEYEFKRNQYIIVDHVYDPSTGRYAKIFTPYVIKFKLEPTMQIYELRFLHVVNSKAREVIYNKRTPNYKGCDTTSAHPTCGKITYNGKMIPYSQGFCCSCDQFKNYYRQPPALFQYTDDFVNYADPMSVLGGIECPRNLRGEDNINLAKDLLSGDREPYPSELNDDRHDKEWKSPLKKILYQSLCSNDMTVCSPDCKRNYTIKIYGSKSNLSTCEDEDEDQQCTNKQKSYANIKSRRDEQIAKILREYDNLKTIYSNRYLDKRFNKDQVEKLNALREYVSDKNSQVLEHEVKNLESMLKARKLVSNALYKRQVQSGGTQRRGGQNCVDRYTPPGINPIAYHESTHCLRFSDLWWTAYHLQPPMIEHTVLFQIFEKHVDLSGTIIWRDITKGKMIKVSSMAPKYMDKNRTYYINYIPSMEKLESTSFALNYKSALLLIPEDVTQSKKKKYPESRGGPPEYLIVHPSQVSLEGDQCNVAGVGFEAFVKQPERCCRPKGSCLTNQPFDLWFHDHQADKQNVRGCFFLKNFGRLPADPIRKYKDSTEKYLLMEYSSIHSTHVDLEIRADFNTILRPESMAKITEVYVDAAQKYKVVVTAKVTNSALVSGYYSVRLSDCPLEVPSAFNNIRSQQVLISPQHQHIFKLVIKCNLPQEKFFCSIEALNSKNQLVALRRIRLQRYDICICAWHCLCACAGGLDGLACIPMSMQHYHAAGFQGSWPISSYVYAVHYSFFDDALLMILYIILSIILILLILGIGKAIIGLFCCTAVGILGFNVILDLPKPINEYKESRLKDTPVVYDDEGWPIDPETSKRVRVLSAPTEFCINVVFFFLYPCNVTYLLFKKICCRCKYRCRDEEESEIKSVESDEINEENTATTRYMIVESTDISDSDTDTLSSSDKNDAYTDEEDIQSMRHQKLESDEVSSGLAELSEVEERGALEEIEEVEEIEEQIRGEEAKK